MENPFIFCITFFKLERTEEEFCGYRDIPRILLTKEEGGKIRKRDEDLLHWFGEIVIKGRAKKIISFSYRLLKSQTHREIISTGEKFQIYRKYNIFDALSIIAKKIDAMVTRTPNKKYIIYLEEEYNDISAMMQLICDENGELEVKVGQVHLSEECAEGNEVFFD